VPGSSATWFARSMVAFRSAVAGQGDLLVLTLGGLTLVSACGLLIAKLLDDVLGSDGATRLDPRILAWAVEHRSDGLTTVARGVTHLGDPAVVAGVAIVCTVWLIFARHRSFGLLVVGSMVGAAITSTVTKAVVGRPRPPETLWLTRASGAAFPSGHATQSVACYGALAVVGWVLVRRSSARAALAFGAVVIAAAVGASRVYLGVHWPSDVLCGWAVAMLWLTTVVLIGWVRPRVVTAWTSSRADRLDDRPA